MKCVFIFWLLLITTIGYAQEDVRDRYLAQTFVSGSDTLLYRLLKPKNYDESRSYPLVIFLHGAGERGRDNFAQLRHGAALFATNEAMEKYPCFVLAPQCPSKKSWANIKFSKIPEEIQLRSKMSRDMQLLMATLGQLMKTYNFDENRLYITGISMGGIGTYDICMRQPNLFAAAVPICGGGDLEGASLIKDIPLWIFHGSEDKPVPAELSRAMVKALKEAGGDPIYTEYAGVGHNSWDNAYSEPEFLPWLFAQKKK